MESYWQEILTFVIVGTAVYLLLKRHFFKKRGSKGVGAAACEPCSTGSCEGCAVLDLKEEIAVKRDAAGDAVERAATSTSTENQAGIGDSDSDMAGTLAANDIESGSAAGSADEVENDPDEGEAPPMKKDYLTQCLDGCIQARMMGLK